MKKATASDVYKALKSLKEDGPAMLVVGICSNLDHKLSEQDRYIPSNFLFRAFEAWPDFSGDVFFPVDGEDAYWEDDEMWVNPKRLQLLDYLIEYFKELDRYDGDEFKMIWSGRKYRCNDTGEVFTIPENVKECDFFKVGDGFVDVGRLGSYSRFGGNIVRVEGDK